MNLATKIISEVDKVLLGKPHVVRLAVTCFLAEGHLLIDDIPGVGKTTLALALAKAIGGRFQRVQFTSDLLPSDVIGVSVYSQKEQRFEYKAGPLFNNIVLADEINRASPKTQSALLEAMQEGQISVETQTFNLPRPFFVIATQNPHEHHGTFPLPESQLDRFLMRLNLGYPDQQTEAAILRGDSVARRSDRISAITDPQAVMDATAKIRTIQVETSVDEYMVQIATVTRKSPLIDLGLSPRGTLALRRAAQAYAFTDGRDFVIPDDVKAVVIAVIAHRIRLRGHFNGNALQAGDALLLELLNQVPVPT